MAGNKEGEKRISAQTIKGVEASFKAYTDTIPTGTENSLIEAPVTANFQAATVFAAPFCAKFQAEQRRFAHIK